MSEMTKQEYARRVVKNLNCLQDKKDEIEKQLLSDIEIALGEGRQLEEILAGMGEPEALAQEFNENFGGEHKGQGKKTKGRRILIIILAVAAVLAAIAGLVYWVLPKARDISISKVFAAETVHQYSEKVVDAFSRGDYDALESYYSPEMRDNVTREMLEEFKPYIGDDWGEYRGIGAIYMTEMVQQGKAYAIAQVNATYEKVSVIYTLSFDKNMQLCGFYMK